MSEAGVQSNVGVNDSYEATLVKGPDPEVWGADEERPTAAAAESTLGGPGVGEIWYEGTPDEVKGPGEQWRQNENGEYINR